MNRLNSHQRGLLLTGIGVLILTPDALLLRLVETDHWTVMFWRSLFSAVSLVAIVSFIEKRSPMPALRGLFKNGLFCAVLFAGSNACFIFSITHTAAANTLVILASTPFIAAVLSVILTRKNLLARTWLAISLAMVGIIIVFWGRFGSGSILGDLIAVLCALFMAGTLISISFNPKINSLAAIAFGSLLAAIFALFMGAYPSAVSITDMTILCLNGAVVIPVAMGMITFGPKLISAPEVSLIMLLETVLGPLWIWLVLNEQPPRLTFFGGALVIAAIMVSAWLSSRAHRIARPL